MYYLLIAAAMGVGVPAEESALIQVTENVVPNEALTAYDQQRINYNVRNWEAELGGQAIVHFGTYDDLEACKAARAEIRLALRDADKADAIRSNCFESREQVASN